MKLNSEIVYKDPDNVGRINMCLDFLLNNQFEQFFQWSKESKEIYTEFLKIKNEEEKNSGLKFESKKRHNKNPDEFINFRHVKPFEIDNIDLADEEEENELQDLLLKDSNNSGSKMKFTEVLTGSEVN